MSACDSKDAGVRILRYYMFIHALVKLRKKIGFKLDYCCNRNLRNSMILLFETYILYMVKSKPYEKSST